MQRLFADYPRFTPPEIHTALALRGRLGRDANGRTLQTELASVLRESGCGEPEADLWRELVGAADDEALAVHAEELERLRQERGR